MNPQKIAKYDDFIEIPCTMKIYTGRRNKNDIIFTCYCLFLMYVMMQLLRLFVIRLTGKLVFCNMLIVMMMMMIIIIIYSGLFNDTFTCS